MVRGWRLLATVALCLGTLVMATLPAAAQGNTIETATSATMGTILTNGSGMTLYYRTNDPAGGSTCTGACAKAWPALTATGAATMASGVTGKVTTFTNPAGATQVAYNGHALYTFAGDSKPGDTKGDGVANVWHVATVSLAAAAPAAALPKTGTSPFDFVGGALLILGGLALLWRRPVRG
ncbi:MAG TPA: LPXTG cell wall anchor domain-containing protein [Bacillota bacterium]|nr:LPXTG cell wall anchor domain-containing protein [Bacillota bacterium]